MSQFHHHRRRKPGTPPPLRLTRHEHQGMALARSLRVFIFFSGPPDCRVWKLYDRDTGDVLGEWCLRSGRYKIHGQAGTCNDWHEVLKLAADALRGHALRGVALSGAAGGEPEVNPETQRTAGTPSSGPPPVVFSDRA